MKVNSSQFNYQYGDQIHFPYSIASLISYIQSKPELSKNLQFEKTFVFRDNVKNTSKDAKILIFYCVPVMSGIGQLQNTLQMKLKKLIQTV